MVNDSHSHKLRMLSSAVLGSLPFTLTLGKNSFTHQHFTTRDVIDDVALSCQ